MNEIVQHFIDNFKVMYEHEINIADPNRQEHEDELNEEARGENKEVKDYD
jgi:hypothetical protein